MIGPTIGIVSPTAAIERDDVEVRHAHQPEADGGERAHHAGQDELRAQPRADLRHGLARGASRRRARRPAGTKRIRYSNIALRFDQQVEAQNQNRDQREDAADDARERDEHGADGVAAACRSARSTPLPRA